MGFPFLFLFFLSLICCLPYFSVFGPNIWIGIGKRGTTRSFIITFGNGRIGFGPRPMDLIACIYGE